MNLYEAVSDLTITKFQMKEIMNNNAENPRGKSKHRDQRLFVSNVVQRLAISQKRVHMKVERYDKIVFVQYDDK